MEIQKLISPLIASQFPDFYKEEGPNFIAFIEAYFEWLEEQDNVINHSRSLLEYFDIDSTLAEFIVYFKNEYLNSLPESIIADKQLLVKHIIDFYRSKGTEKAYRLLFRMFFNEDIEIYVPGKFLFSPSEAEWYVPQYIEVSSDVPLSQYVGLKIRSSGGATAVVENYFQKNVNNKIVDVLYLSNVEGSFAFNEKIICDDLPNISLKKAPIVFGSFSTVSILDGGTGYKVGDLLSAEGSGSLGKVRVASTTENNGKVTFTLVDGGYGYSVNAIVSVTGGNGTGANFEIGDITDKQIYIINTDIINILENTNLELIAQGFELAVSSASGAFTNGEKLLTSANVIHLDVTYVAGTDGGISNGTILSNTSLGISGLTVYNSDYSMLYITGTDSNITNANIVPGVLLSNGSYTVSVNATYPKVTVTSNAIVNGFLSNTTVVTVYNPSASIGYIIPGSTITGNVSAQTATVSSVTRLTDWATFVATIDPQNLDTKIDNAFNNVVKEIGRITYLSRINPGSGYSSDPTVSIIEPLIRDLYVSDGQGNFWGNNAIVTADAGIASGIVTGINIIDSGYGYVNNEKITLVSPNNATVISGVTVAQLTGKNAGYWKNNKSFPSDTNYIQDSYYYQHYSYEILANRMKDTYEDFVKTLIHPAGLMMFGSFINKTEMVSQQSELRGYSRTKSTPVTVNSTEITVDSIVVTADECDIFI